MFLLTQEIKHQGCVSAFMTNTDSLYREFPDGCNQPLQISQGPATHLEVPWSFVLDEGFCQSKITTAITYKNRTVFSYTALTQDN